MNFKINADGSGFEWARGRPVILDGGAEETAQRLGCNLSTVRGELAWLGEDTLGFLELSDDFLGKVPNVQKVRQRARQEILGTQGVASLQQVEVEEPEGADRGARMTFHATADTGETLEGEVTGP